MWLFHNLQPGSTTIDIGASFGLYSLVAARAAGPSGRVLSFEPTGATFNILQRNVALNHLANVEVFNCALGDRDDEVQFFHHPDSSRNSLGLVSGMSGASETVKMTTLSQICQQTQTTSIDLIKIDVEGAEETTLNGCLPILQLSRPRMIIEINPPRAAAIGLRPDGAWQMLLDLDYRFEQIESDGKLRKLTSLPDRPMNLVATPREIHAASDGRC